jgi:hypothetical protein
MSPPRRSLIAFVFALVAVPFLPIYVAKTMTRKYAQGGDDITYGWDVVTLPGYGDHMAFAVPEQDPLLWLGVNFGVAVLVAAGLAFAATRLWNRLQPLPM